MKKLLVLLLFTSLSTAVIAQEAKLINIESSSINWEGKKALGKHEGSVMLKSGTLIFKGKKLVGGNFIVDMTTISSTDVSGKSKENLDNHLKSDDFFGVEQYETSSLKFTTLKKKSKNNYTITADLTIKGITNPIVFDIALKGNSANAKLTIDRTKYGIKYKSKTAFADIGDKFIYDDFTLDVNLIF